MNTRVCGVRHARRSLSLVVQELLPRRATLHHSSSHSRDTPASWFPFKSWHTPKDEASWTRSLRSAGALHLSPDAPAPKESPHSPASSPAGAGFERARATGGRAHGELEKRQPGAGHKGDPYCAGAARQALPGSPLGDCRIAGSRPSILPPQIRRHEENTQTTKRRRSRSSEHCRSDCTRREHQTPWTTSHRRQGSAAYN